MNSSFPASLITDTPAEGHALARQLAEQVLVEEPILATMPDYLSTSASRSELEELTVLYFQTIAAANAGWAGGRPQRVPRRPRSRTSPRRDEVRLRHDIRQTI
jgi:hypothetical protein